MIRLLAGDCRETLRTLDAGLVQCVVTSPPYYGLRDYGLPPLVWGGDPQHEHEWGATVGIRTIGADNDKPAQVINSGQYCSCGAWRGSHGFEPMPELYIQHEVEIFREVKRVLRDDATVWLNLGDSYAGSGKGPTGHNGIGDQIERQGFDKSDTNRGSLKYNPNGGLVPANLKAKDLMMLPFRVAMALQADGWWIRSVIPWLKRNSMPESVRDRPAAAVDYVFLLSKSARYFYDADAVRPPQSDNTHSRGTGSNPKAVSMGQGIKNNNSFNAATNGQWLPNGRSRRNSDWFFESWQGLLHGDDDEPLALIVNPAPFKESHFATFPPKLVEPMIKAGSRPGDTILDPFFGSGTVGLVADRLGRNAIGCELNPSYVDMGTDRIVGDAPLFTEIESPGGGGISEPVKDKQGALGKPTYTGFNERYFGKKDS